ELAGSVEATRGCKHLCRHCPIPPVYGGRFFVVPRHVVLADIRQQVEAGASHITFGDPDFLNGPGHALAVARALHAELPSVTLDDYRELLDFVEAHELIDAIDPVQYSIRLLVPPGSLLLESGAMRPFLGPLVQDAFYYRWIHPDPRMERLAGDVAALVAQAAE